MSRDEPPLAASTDPEGPRSDGRPTGRELTVWGLLVLVILALVGLSIWHRLQPPVVPPAVLGAVPPFVLTDRDGAPVTGVDLAGAPYVADFFFTRCVGICPRLTQQMQRVVRAAGPDTPAHFVSISVDPAHDTPAVLDAYAARVEAPAHWHFLTGERDAIYSLIGDGFKLAVDDAPDPARTLPGEDILHSNRFVLVDGEGRIRGYYDAFDEEALAQLLVDLETLLG